ncbi:hypothetical protein DPMN_078474 [Dreissena polymorpha]|uniref:Uncharacterized protein n=1 Tax=Dreissena polymorpha TaxID=45954 RepID=A0A9D3YSJ3_DREPO|nr:hypothetical protein DPMN_078474 [Dreissena polymorpha]
MCVLTCGRCVCSPVGDVCAHLWEMCVLTCDGCVCSSGGDVCAHLWEMCVLRGFYLILGKGPGLL